VLICTQNECAECHRNDGTGPPTRARNNNGNVANATGSASDNALNLTSDLSSATNDTGLYAQSNTVNIAIFDTLRGVSLKELFAINQSGMTYSPETEEMLLGTIRLKSLIQRQIFQGNSGAAGVLSLAGYPSSWLASTRATASSELGLANAAGFDGLRMITAGGVPATLGAGSGYQTQYSTSAIAVDQDLTAGGGPFTITQAVNYGAAQVMNNGGNPSILVGSPIVLNKLMNEQEGKQRTQEDLIPGVPVMAINTVAGNLPYVYAPGSGTSTNSALGTYNRASDGALVEDLYVLDESMITLRYLGSADIGVIEIPVGVDSNLSRRFILYAMMGLQIADSGLFQAKIRIPV